MSVNKDYLISDYHINTMVALALETHDQKKPEFLGAAIEHLDQYPLTQEQNNKIVAILKSVASDNISQAPSLITQVLNGGTGTIVQPLTAPMSQSALAHATGTTNDFFLQMPPETQRTVLFTLNLKDIVTCSAVCKSLKQTVQDDIFGRAIFCRDFQAHYPKPASGFYRACQDCYVSQLNFQNGVFARRTLEGQCSMRGLRGGEMFYSWSQDGTISIWDLEVKKCLKIMHRDPSSSSALIFVNGTFYSGRANGAIEVLDLGKGGRFLTLKGHQTQGQGNCFTSFAFGDGVLYSGSFDRTVKIWDPKTGKCLNTLEGHADYVCVLAYSDGMLCSGSSRGMIKIWDPRTGECMHTIQAHNNVITGLIFCNGLLYSSGMDGLIREWNPKTGALLRAIRGNIGPILSLISFHGNLYSSSTTGSIKIWDPKNVKCLHTFEMRLGGIHCLAQFNGKLCAASSRGGIEIWDFMEKDTVIFRELAGLLRSGNDEANQEAMERFSKMPTKAKNKIYELCGIPASNDDCEQRWTSTPVEQRADAIERYVKSQEESNTSPSST